MKRVLGLDGGGTKKDAVVVDHSGAVLVRSRTGALDPTTGDDWKQRLTDLSGELGPVSAAVLGLPYHGEIPQVSAGQTALAIRLFGSNSSVVNDVSIAFDGALGGADGVLILSRTVSLLESRHTPEHRSSKGGKDRSDWVWHVVISGSVAGLCL